MRFLYVSSGIDKTLEYAKIMTKLGTSNLSLSCLNLLDAFALCQRASGCSNIDRTDTLFSR